VSKRPGPDRPWGKTNQELPMSTLAPSIASISSVAVPGVRLHRRIAARVPGVARVLFGLAFAVFGLNGFLDFLPHPTTPPPAGAAEFGYALLKTGYMFPLIKGTELAVGLLLLANLWVPFALILLAPVLVNIVAFHAFLAPDGLGLALVLVAFEVGLAWHYRSAFRPLYSRRA
jgi:hypothetical protein